MRRHPGRTGFVAGLAVGAVVAILVAVALPVLLRDRAGPEPGTLVILSGTDDGYGGQRQALIDQWNALGDRPRAEIVPVTGGTDAERDEMLVRAQAGGGDVDIYNLDVPRMAEFVDAGYLRPLDEDRLTDLDGFLENPLNSCRRAGRLWALPFNTDAGLLYYRADLVPAAEPPSSWPGIVSWTEKALAGPPPKPPVGGGPAAPAPVAGYTGQFADYEGLTVNALEAIWAAGGDVVDRDGNVVIDSPEARDGLTRLAVGLGRGNPQIVLPDSTTFKEAEAAQAFRDGKVVFMRNWPVWYQRFAGGESGRPPVPFGVTRVPGRSVLGGQNLAVAAHSRHPRAAQELIEFLTSARSQQILFERGGFAATREVVYHDQQVRKVYPYADTLLDAVKQARLRPDTRYYAEFSRVFREGVRQALANGGQLPAGFSDRLSRALKGVR
ncbi:extracellular solute-binding protein [Micromonospora zhanjiangensis]|uniref:Extracellular solute-binding protein n=1 Tax=Micromonospora zhanjiangensis TaxID=1522057 RepID=A0ABV8KMK0_9ACTN